eukprot:TRINITY_DN58607_c0_g1_i1.p1 TRINITY_DN58607_c0_g1~~TRINITY_DN58607_c0_g1_i1.p1  ORF type:complete len:489 (+),score=87.27 TRINITY_DN58607_c0_g1_i1:56-1522(+)
MEAVIKAFHEWDADGAGTIERCELEAVMARISPQWGPRQITQLMNQVDQNGDGVIDLDEFVAWLTDPTAKQTLHKDGWFGSFDLAAVIRPLYDLFDQDNSGVVSIEEFKECHSILRTSLQLHPSACQDKASSIAGDADTTFGGVDQDHDGFITFEEFCRWQGEVMRKSGIPNGILPDVIEELVGALSLILDIDRRSQSGQQIEGSLEALQNGIAKLAAASRQVYSDKDVIDQLEQERSRSRSSKQGERSETYSNTWCDGAPNENELLMLIRQCTSELGVSLVADSRGPRGPRIGTRRNSRAGTRAAAKPVDRSALPQIRILIPCMHEPGEAAKTWLAQVKRKSVAGANEFFLYEYSGTRWKRCEDEASFKAALEGLRPWVCVHSCLVAQALGKPKMNYQAVDRALDAAVEMDWIRKFAADRVCSNLRRTVTDNMDHYHYEELKAAGELEAAIDHQLSKIQLSPSDVFDLLTGVGVSIDAAARAQVKLK